MKNVLPLALLLGLFFVACNNADTNVVTVQENAAAVDLVAAATEAAPEATVTPPEGNMEEAIVEEAVVAEQLDYKVVDGQFETSEGTVPTGCFGQLMMHMNGDNSGAAIFLNRASLRGCIAANFPYPGGDPASISYVINESLQNNVFKLTITETMKGGSMGASLDNVIVQFVNRDYTMADQSQKKVLSLEKIGEWE